MATNPFNAAFADLALNHDSTNRDTSASKSKTDSPPRDTKGWGRPPLQPPNGQSDKFLAEWHAAPSSKSPPPDSVAKWVDVNGKWMKPPKGTHKWSSWTNTWEPVYYRAEGRYHPTKFIGPGWNDYAPGPVLPPPKWIPITDNDDEEEINHPPQDESMDAVDEF